MFVHGKLLFVSIAAAMPLFFILCSFAGRAGAQEREPSSQPSVVISVDGDHPDQTWEGFGSTDLFGLDGLEVEIEAGKPGPIPEEGRKAVLRLYYEEMGMTRLRFFPVGYEPVNDNDDPAVTNGDAFKWDFRGDRRKNGLDMYYRDHVKMGAAFRNPKELFTLFPANHYWEEWMGRRPFNPAMVDEYAEHAYAAVQHWKKDYAFEMPYWSLFNEPWNSAKLTPETTLALVLAVGRRFKAAGFGTKLTVNDDVTVEASRKHIETVLNHEEARDYVGSVSYHRYCGIHENVPGMIEAANHGKRILTGPVPFFDLARKHGKSVWLTECTSYDSKSQGMTHDDVGRARANHIAEEINIARVNAFDFMLCYFIERKAHDEEAFIYLRFEKGQYQKAEIEAKGDWYAAFTRYIRPGAVRLPSTSTERRVLPTAFWHKANETVTVVLINNVASDVSAQIELKGTAVEKCQTRVRTAPPNERKKTLDPVAVEAGRLTDVLPGRSITTYILTKK